MSKGESIWSNCDEQLQLSEYSEKMDVFECPAKWHLNKPEFLKGFGKFNKYLKDENGDNFPGWVISVNLRGELIDELEQKLQRHFSKASPKARTESSAATATATAVAHVPVHARVNVRPRVRVQEEPLKNTISTNLTAIRNALTFLIGEEIDTFVSADNLVISGKETHIVNDKSQKLAQEGWKIVMWSETEDGAVVVMSKK